MSNTADRYIFQFPDGGIIERIIPTSMIEQYDIRHILEYGNNDDNYIILHTSIINLSTPDLDIMTKIIKNANDNIRMSSTADYFMKDGKLIW